MKLAALGTNARAPLALLLTLLLFLALATPAFAEGQTATDSAQLSDVTLAKVGEAKAVAQGVAVAGPARALSKAIVQQINVQVVAGPKETRSNSTQTATNEANVNQTTLAASGDATGADGGVALTGSATAGSLAIVHQINIQIIAGWAPSGGVTQTASNTADVDQTTVAASGSADASGDGSVARSGDASALSVTRVHQKNIQIYVGRKPFVTDGPVVQTATNSLSVDQTTLALTGDAVAADHGVASTGDARARAFALAKQTNRQLAW